MAKSAAVEQNNTMQRVRALSEIAAELINTPSAFESSKLREVKSFDDAMKLAASAHGKIELASDVIGDGFALLDDKDVLIGRPLFLLDWTIRPGDFGNFVSVYALAENPDRSVSKYIFNDGSTGVAEQLARYSLETNKFGGLMVSRGLRRSDYDYTDKDGNVRPASTHYLDTAV